MLPADGVLRAAQRWLHLLARSAFVPAAAIVRSDPAYTDLSQTQYASALEWLKSAGLLVDSEHGPALATPARRLEPRTMNRLIFSRALEQAPPPWLPDADMLVPDADELPADAAGLAEALGLTPNDALLAVRQIHRRIDLAERARVGAVGERALVEVLERHWPNSTRHLSLDDDGLGYDIEFTCDGNVWHLEAKSTTRRGRLTIHLSRHEHEIAKLDPAWRLVVIGVDETDRARVIASVPTMTLLQRAPRDIHPASGWDSARYRIAPQDLEPGLTFLGTSNLSAWGEDVDGGGRFAWMSS